jgi:hypothetical protein
MAELVQRCAVPVDRFEIRLGPRHLNVVERGGIERFVAAQAQVGPARADQGLDLGQDETVRDRRRNGDQVGGKSVALGDVEHGEALQERYRVRLVALLPRPGALLVRDKPVGEHHRGATLTFADISAQAQGLAEGEPALAREAMLDNGPHRMSTLMPE